MKIDEIDAFVAVIRLQSLSLAAEYLQLTQSAITRRLQSLEESLGVPLLDRHTKPLKPTAMGLRVYEQCRAILREVDILRDLVTDDAVSTGALRLGVPQTIGDAVLLEALQQLQQTYPELQTQVANGWGGNLVKRVVDGELDAAAVLFPSGKEFPEGIVAESLSRMDLVVVAAKGRLPKRSYRLADCQAAGWVLNPDGCGFRAGLQRTLLQQGLNLKVNLEIFGTDLQLGLVAKGMGMGLVPFPLLQNSRHLQQLEVVAIADFKPVIDLWLVRPSYVGNLHGAIQLFGEMVARRLG